MMEKVPWEKYTQHCSRKLQQLDPWGQPQDFEYYYQQLQKAKQKIQRLESQRLNQPVNSDFCR